MLADELERERREQKERVVREQDERDRKKVEGECAHVGLRYYFTPIIDCHSCHCAVHSYQAHLSPSRTSWLGRPFLTKSSARCVTGTTRCVIAAALPVFC